MSHAFLSARISGLPRQWDCQSAACAQLTGRLIRAPILGCWCIAACYRTIRSIGNRWEGTDMHSILLIQPFAHEDHDGEGQPDHDGGEYGNLLLKCCEAAMDFVEANENEDAKNA